MINFDDLTPAQQEAIQNYKADIGMDDWNSGEWDCVDNLRYARVDNQAELDAYADAVVDGCCGSHDVELGTADGTVKFGFNYGH